MYLGLPIVAFDVSYNRATTEDRAFYFSSPEDIVDIVSKKKAVEYRGNRLIMKIIADERYTWGIISEKYAKLIEATYYNRSVKISAKLAD